MDKPRSSPDDYDRYEKCLDEASVPFTRIVQESFGLIVVFVEDQFGQAAITALRQMVFKVDGSSMVEFPSCPEITPCG
jgi:hypothetical protein